MTDNTLPVLAGVQPPVRGSTYPAAIIDGEARFPEGAPARALKSPLDGAPLGSQLLADPALAAEAVERAQAAFMAWRTVPAPRRGELVRRIGEAVRQNKRELARIITLEAGKIPAEAEGEVQEWIDICEFAVGLSRQLHGLTIASERPDHRMMEQWLPLGPVGVITAFNFPVAVWAWNAMLAFVCGDSVIWKPSEKTPLCALAVQTLVGQAIASMDEAPAGLSQLVVGLADVGEAIAADTRVPLVSATGSVRMGKRVAATVGARLGRSLLELGGNNAMIVTPTARLDLALRAIVFAAAGTAGQRCTTLRRLIVHESVLPELLPKLVKAYESLPVGDPRVPGTLVGPLIDAASFEAMQLALDDAKIQGGRIVCGGRRIADNVPAGGFYVQPAIVEVPGNLKVVCHETFAPILYVMTYRELDEAIALNNGVPQGLSSAIFTERMQEAERFMAAAGSDCGIANVNIGTSGAEIGGAFGGEKETGGGRESGSDSWKAYMRRTTNTINYGDALPLAQGIRFDV
ncbi:aldehyde dehydrogenase family protein [Niveibacterium umoris]|uniref:aldehyde dehydrogenase (NAD(+)) n=1 Tax=Niveibacterium umoris TaxID=1193620 RepID=A0A840BJZ0_9RHOO|nr:aldehyde dehydrogenase family protein [Niveibacterium umoris]MBB4010867.1 aldehyde dehydrogenase (NAD+) [Niveibacterium umoris]